MDSLSFKERSEVRMGFNEISARYERDSIVQSSAAGKLLGLLDIKRDDDVLDLGCGAGNLTKKLRALTAGKVVGIDPSEGMIREAEAKRDGHDIAFSVINADTMQFRDRFSAIFCNSVFQWFRDPALVLKNCHTALRKGGRMAIQAPATKDYCPQFIAAVNAAANDARTAKTYSSLGSPWLFLETAEEYAALFRRAGFTVPFAKIETISSVHSPDEAMTIFESGAAAGYLNQEHYSTKTDEEYTKAFREIVRISFQRQTRQDGKIELVFNRIYLVAIKL